MRHLAAAIILASLLIPLGASTARAQDSGFGLGIILGDPNGVSGKGWLVSGLALDGAVGFGIIDEGHLAAHVDVLWHMGLKDFSRASMDLYFGVGGKIGAFEDDFRLGARGPVGLDFLFQRPVDVFIEIAAGLWIIDDVDFDLDAAAGVRYWF
jgi:hypothetical protein